MKNYFHKTRTLTLLLAAWWMGGIALAQDAPKKADALYKQGAYAEAAKAYERFLASNTSLDASLGLARCYRALGQNDKAEQQYGSVVFNAKSLPEHKLELGKFLKTVGKYEKAKTWFIKYGETGGDSLLATRWAASCDFAKASLKDSLGYQIIRTTVPNSKDSEISPVWYKNGLLFASNRTRGFFFRFVNGKSKAPFYDLYFSEFTPDGILGKPEYQKNNLNTKFHDGPLAMPAAENVAYITRTNTEGLGTARDAAGYSRVNVYRIENHLDRWRKGTPVPFSSAEYNIAHPAISSDGSTLYFVSDMPGGYGGTDIYRTRLLSAGWTTPENLGPSINTDANEGYPYLGSDSTMFFSSDRAEGMGGKDIFTSTLRDGKWLPARNAGYPLNTPHDDFGFCISPIRPVGYFSTNRPGGKGDDDIWAFKRYRSVEATFIDALTLQPLEGVRVVFTDINQKTSTFTTGPDGRVKYTIRTGQEAFLDAGKDEYQDHKETVSVRSIGPDQDLYKTIRLQGVKRYLVAGTVVDARTRQPLKDVVVRVIGTKEERRFTDDKGQYQVPIEPGQAYTLIMQHPDRVPQVFNFNTKDDQEPRTYRYDGALKSGPYLWVEGQAYDPERQRPVSSANVHILNADTRREVTSFSTREDGLFWQVLDDARSYTVVAARGDYFTTTADLRRDSLVSDTANLRMEMLPMQPGRVFKTLYYDYNSSAITAAGRRDLQELAFFLQENPGISIELSSHTDSRGGADFNKKLSQTRADLAVEQLVGLGIDKSRIKAVGYGEERLVNNCGDGVQCTEELHAQNRRTELKVIRVDREVQGQKPVEDKEQLKGNVIPEGKELLKGAEDPAGKDILKGSQPPASIPDGDTPPVEKEGDGGNHAPADPPIRGSSIEEPAPRNNGNRQDDPWRVPGAKLF